jgi:V8-like Glu-specific endopeptidase
MDDMMKSLRDSVLHNAHTLADAPLSNALTEMFEAHLSHGATAEVPEALRHIDARTDYQKIERVWIDRDAAGASPPIALAGHRPSWEAASISPRPHKRDLFNAGQVRYRGHPVTPHEMIGNDDRQFYSDNRYPWGCVCRIMRNGQFSGSGMIVGPRHVLTASHVVPWGNINCSVEVNRDGGNLRASTRVERAIAFTKVKADSNFVVQYDEMDEDYAVLITAERIGDRFGWLGTRSYDNAWDGRRYWYNVAYTSDRSDTTRPLWQSQKYLDELPGDYGPARAMSTDADTWFGMSGSPMFSYWAGGNSPGWSVVSVVSSGMDWPIFGPSNYCAGGSYLTRLVNESRRRYA